jgi:hypothetical protein
MTDDANVGLGGVEEPAYIGGSLLVIKRHKDDGALPLAQRLNAVGEDLAVGLKGGCWSGMQSFGTESLEKLFAPVGGAAKVEDHHSAGAQDEGFHLVGFAESSGAESLEGRDEDLLDEVFSSVVIAKMTKTVAADARSHGAAEFSLCLSLER